MAIPSNKDQRLTRCGPAEGVSTTSRRGRPNSKFLPAAPADESRAYGRSAFAQRRGCYSLTRLLMPCFFLFVPPAYGGTRPALEVHQGQYFRWAMPQGWRAQETTNGVDMVAPDGKTMVSSALLTGGFGPMTPRNFLTMTLQLLRSPARITSEKPLPDQPGMLGQPWRVSEFELASEMHGIPVRAIATVGVIQAFGRYSATTITYQAPVSRWAQQKHWLPAIAHSVTITNPRQVSGQDRVMLPRNNPLDNSGLIESWRQKGLSEDRISKARREGTMGYERLEDAATGQKYELPLEAYDGTVGGYRNPKRPTELLRRLPPGK